MHAKKDSVFSKPMHILGKILGWFFGIIFLLAGLGSIISSDFISAISMFILSILCIPIIYDKFISKRLSLSTGKRILLIFGIFFLFGIIQSINLPYYFSDNYREDQEIRKQLAAERNKAPEKTYLEEDLTSILFKFTNPQSSLTDLQRKELWKNYNDQLIKGTAYVEKVDQNMFGQYVILANIMPKGEFDFGNDLAIFFKSSEKDKLLKVSKGSSIQFEGKLDAYHSTLGNLDIVDAILITE